MEYSSAEMTCVLKVNTQCEECKIKVMKVLRNIRGVYNITIDADKGTVKVTGRVNPSTVLGVLDNNGKHAEVKYIKFDGEVVERSPHYYGEYGYDPYGREGSYPLLACPQHQNQWYPTSPSLYPPPPPPGPPPPPRPPPPVAPYWGPPPPPYGPLPLGPFGPPPPPSHSLRGGKPGQNKKVEMEQNHCAIM